MQRKHNFCNVAEHKIDITHKNKTSNDLNNYAMPCQYEQVNPPYMLAILTPGSIMIYPTIAVISFN